MLLGTVSAGLLENYLTGKEAIKAGEGSTKAGQHF